MARIDSPTLAPVSPDGAPVTRGNIHVARSGRRPLALAIAIALVGVYISLQLRDSLAAGGDAWKQGDWLINNQAGLIRRGPLGSLLILLSDTLPIDLLSLLIGTQLVLFVVLMSALIVAVRSLSQPLPYWLLFSSPGFLIIFWAADPEAGMRKELIAFAAFAVLLLVVVRPAQSTAWLAISLALFAVAIVGHEVNVLFAPAYATVLVIALSHRGFERRRLGQATGLVFGLCAIAGLYVVAFARADDASEVCTPLLARGFDAQICDGAIKWLEYDASYGLERTTELLSTSAGQAFPIAYLMVCIPLLYLISLHSRPRLLTGAFIACALPFLPLYVIGIDWGRWMNLHISSFVFVLLALVLSGRITLVRQRNMAFVVCIVAMSLLWSPHHNVGIREGLATQIVGALIQ